jgi:hypothetical protein
MDVDTQKKSKELPNYLRNVDGPVRRKGPDPERNCPMDLQMAFDKLLTTRSPIFQYEDVSRDLHTRFVCARMHFACPRKFAQLVGVMTHP